jgi:hypothetical protein
MNIPLPARVSHLNLPQKINKTLISSFTQRQPAHFALFSFKEVSPWQATIAHPDS